VVFKSSPKKKTNLKLFLISHYNCFQAIQNNYQIIVTFGYIQDDSIESREKHDKVMGIALPVCKPKQLISE
jgi:hypothetical protein